MNKSTNSASSSCSLCGDNRLDLWHQAEHVPIAKRRFYACQACGLVQVPAVQYVAPDVEQQVYNQHTNDPQDAGYRQFLRRALTPVINRLPQGAQGLDFGSGPGPTLSLMFSEVGYPCTTYDLYYDHQPQRLQQTYDFITATEVFEHLHNPAATLDRLCQCLKPGGLLLIMTQRVRDQKAFKTWRYIHDPTHVCFFAERTMDYIGHNWPLHELERGRDTVLWQKTR